MVVHTNRGSLRFQAVRREKGFDVAAIGCEVKHCYLSGLQGDGDQGDDEWDDGIVFLVGEDYVFRVECRLNSLFYTAPTSWWKLGRGFGAHQLSMLPPVQQVLVDQWLDGGGLLEAPPKPVRVRP